MVRYKNSATPEREIIGPTASKRGGRMPPRPLLPDAKLRENPEQNVFDRPISGHPTEVIQCLPNLHRHNLRPAHVAAVAMQQLDCSLQARPERGEPLQIHDRAWRSRLSGQSLRNRLGERVETNNSATYKLLLQLQ